MTETWCSFCFRMPPCAADMYYHGLPTDIIAENTKTAHKWGFTKNLTEQARA